MTARGRARRAALHWAMRHRFPLRRELLVQHHLLPAARLRALSDALVPRGDEDPVEVVTLRDGTRMELDLRSLAQRAIAYGLSDESELLLLPRIVRPGDTVFDVGANVGLYALALSRAVGPEGRVHAFEPNPETVARLRRNLELNNGSNVSVHAAAVAAESGEAVLRTSDPSESGLATIVGDGVEVARVEQVTLDEVAEHERVERISLLKVDAEGAEEAVLRGASRLLENGRIDSVLFEVLDGSTSVQRLLADAGYALEVVLPPGEFALTQPCGPAESFSYANILATR